MKNTSIILMFLTVILAANISNAVPIGSSGADRDYLISEQPLQKWSLGVFAEKRNRDVYKNSTLNTVEMETSKFMGYVGYDAITWITTYLTYGTQEDKIWGSKSDESTYGVGAVFNLLDHEMMDPALIEDRIRVNATVQYTFGSYATGFDQKADMDELYGSLTISLVNDIDGNKMYWPNAVSIFAGPAYSDLQCDVIDEDKALGFVAGIEIFLTENVTLGIGMEDFGDTGGWMALSVKL